jgi:hypothetical protein
MSEQVRGAAPGAQAPSARAVADEANLWLVGGGVLAVALAPLALPFVLLGVVFLLPVLPLALAPALIVAPIWLVRRLRRRVARTRLTSAAEPLPRSAHRPA